MRAPVHVRASGFTTHTLACLCFKLGQGLDVGEVKPVRSVRQVVVCQSAPVDGPQPTPVRHAKRSMILLPRQRVRRGTTTKKKLTRARFELAPLSRPRIVIKG